MNSLYLRLFIFSLNKNLTQKGSLPLIVFVLLLLATNVASYGASENSEASRLLVHTLNYIGRDYPNGVENGKVKSADEYKEMLGFIASADKYYQTDKTLWAAADTANIGSLIRQLDSLVYAKANAAVVATTANRAKAAVIQTSGLKVAPAQYPSLLKGKVVFAAQCAKCHGNTGYGDGKEGEKLDPKPRNFHDEQRMGLISPFGVYNTVRCGVQGTGMKAHPDLQDDEVWDVAWYVLTLRYESKKQDKQQAEKIIAERFKNINLEGTATLNDAELSEKYKASKEEIALLRYQQPDDGKGQFIEAALKYIDEAMLASRAGNYEGAEKLSTLAYLEGIEPIEKQLRSTDPALMERLEDQMANTRKIIASHRGLAEINDSLKTSKVLIDEVGKTLNGEKMSFWLAMLMAMSILLREGLEAFLVIMVVLGIVKASGRLDARKYVHIGWLAAIAVGMVLWVIGGRIVQAHMAQVELMEGIIAIVAVVMLLYIGFWLHGKSEVNKWKDYVTQKVKGATGSNSLIGLFGLSFFVVFREVFESVLFLSAINIESGGKQEQAIGAAVLLSLAIVISLAWLVLKFATKLPVPKLFKISSIVMAALAVVLAGKGVHSFQETGFIGIHGVPIVPRIELLGIWSTAETLGAQVAVLLLVIYVMRYVNRKVVKS